jgi:catechol 2,3-dioxygenase-like lactoylglutathione lyase family enzyme
MKPETLDHVALWVGDRDTLADFLVDRLGMHVIERTDNFTLVGADARRGKLTLFAAEGDREPGVLSRIALRVFDLEEALAELPPDVAVERPTPGRAAFTAPEGLPLALVEAEAASPTTSTMSPSRSRIPSELSPSLPSSASSRRTAA